MSVFRRGCSGIFCGDQPREDSYTHLNEPQGFPVRLNVYDLYWMNSYTSPIGIGVYHTGLEVHGSEFGFGGHPYSVSGIFEIDPQCAHQLGPNFQYKQWHFNYFLVPVFLSGTTCRGQSVLLGYTSLDIESVHEIVRQFGQDFKGYSYHLVHKNCNHFSMALSRIVCGAEIPAWVNRLASLTACMPFIQRCIPADWLTPVALAETMRTRDGSGDANSRNANRNSTSTTSSNEYDHMNVNSERHISTVPIFDGHGFLTSGGRDNSNIDYPTPRGDTS